MLRNVVKPARMIISVLFLSVVVVLFSFPLVILPAWITSIIVFPQFIPSITGFLNSMSWLSAGFIVVLVVTLLFGRIYCSSVCPFGTLLDVVTGIRRRFQHHSFRLSKAGHHGLHYSVAALAFIPLLFHSVLVAGLTDPFGLTGRMCIYLFRPLFHPGLYPLTLSVAFWFALFVFFFLLISSYRADRWFCNTLCPVGGVLALTSRYSLFRFRIKIEHCTRCGSCLDVCKAHCIDEMDFVIDHTSCVSCFNCINVCSEKAVVYATAAKDGLTGRMQPDVSRRNFLITTAMAVAGVSGLVVLRHLVAEKDLRTSGVPVLPPGAGDPAHFTENCISCHLCVSVCPTRVVQPAIFLPGGTGLLQPRLDFNRGYCEQECVRCSAICPSGALIPLKVAEKKRLKIGEAVFMKNQCIVVAERRSCGLCAASCPTGAITLVPYLEDLLIPLIDSEKCTGCGACEYICPARPGRAIGVEGVFIPSASSGNAQFPPR